MSHRSTALLVAASCLLGCRTTTGDRARDDAPDNAVGAREETVAELPERLASSLGASFELSFPADPAEDPLGLEGLTHVLITLATSEGQERAAAYGATLEGFRHGDVAGWRITGPAASFESLALIVLDLALDPRLPGTDLSTLSERWRERMHVHPDATLEAARRWATALATGHGRPVGVTPTDGALATLNREELVRLHRRLVRPERWRIEASHPLGPAVLERLDFHPAPAAELAKPCLAPHASTYVMPGEPPGDVIAARAPAAEVEAWLRVLAPLARYPSLAAAELRRLGPEVVVIVSDASDATRAWEAIAARLERLVGELPPGLVRPAWTRVRIGGGTGLELTRDGALCRR